MLRSRALVAAAITSALALAACSGGGTKGSTSVPPPPPGPVTTAVGTALEPALVTTLGTAGGTATSVDGRLTVTLPAGVLSADTGISVQRITNEAPGGNGAAYRLLPARTFSSPVTLTFDASGLGSADAGGLGVAYQTAAGQWSWIADGLSRNVGTRRVSVTTTHFTDFSLVSAILLQPLAASVPTGGSVALEVAACFEPKADGDLASLVAWDCSPDLAHVGVLLDAASWSVNGVAGGNGTVGTITPGAGLGATYHAPATAPSPSTVVVTVKTQAMAGRPQATLYAHVTVGRPGPLSGSISGTGTFYGLYGPLEFRIDDVVLTVHDFGGGVYDDGPDETNYDLTGTMQIPASFGSGGITCTVSQPTAAISDTNFKVLKDPPAVRFAVTAEFPATCSFGTTTVMVTYGTYIPGCASSPLLVDAPILDTRQVEGRYATQCTMSRVDGSWSFHP